MTLEDPGFSTLRISLNPANAFGENWTQPTSISGALPLTVTLDAEYTFSEATLGEDLFDGQTRIEWGDGAVDLWGNSATSRTISWHPIPGNGVTHTYAEPGTYTVTVRFTAPASQGRPYVNGVQTSVNYPPIDLTATARVTVTNPNPDPVTLAVIPGDATYSFS